MDASEEEGGEESELRLLDKGRFDEIPVPVRRSVLKFEVSLSLLQMSCTQMDIGERERDLWRFELSGFANRVSFDDGATAMVAATSCCKRFNFHKRESCLACEERYYSNQWLRFCVKICVKLCVRGTDPIN